MLLKRLLNPWPDAPLPLWMIFPVIFAALYAAHFKLLNLPYYWDEAGYYIPAAWDFFRTGSVVPISTVSNAHPPLPSLYLALWWKTSGYLPWVTREAVLLVAAFALLAVWRLAMRLTSVASVAFWTALLTGLYPVWFAQSTLAHADIFAAACALWGMVYALPRRGRRPAVAALWFAAATLCKETAIILPLTLALVDSAEAWRHHSSVRHRLMREAAWMSACILPLGGWYLYHHARTGYFFGNPEFLRYNAVATLEPLRVLAAFGHRILHLTVHMNLFVPVLIGLAALLLNPRPDAEGRERASIAGFSRVRIFALLLANAVFFSFLGGALLTRYLLPMYPLVLLLALMTMYRRVPYWQAVAVLSAGAFIAGLFINPPYGFAPEDNLAYADVIHMDMAGIAQLRRRYPDAVVLTAWPMSDYLTKPELGYVKKPWKVVRLEDFTAQQIQTAAQEQEKYSAALVFSTKYEPPPSLFSMVTKSEERMNERYFGLHHDLPPEQIALRLNGTLVWQEENQGLWVALLRFNRQVEARADPRTTPGRP